MITKKFDFSDVRQCGKLCVNFRSVTLKDTSCTFGLSAKLLQGQTGEEDTPEVRWPYGVYQGS